MLSREQVLEIIKEFIDRNNGMICKDNASIIVLNECQVDGKSPDDLNKLLRMILNLDDCPHDEIVDYINTLQSGSGDNDKPNVTSRVTKPEDELIFKMLADRDFCSQFGTRGLYRMDVNIALMKSRNGLELTHMDELILNKLNSYKPQCGRCGKRPQGDDSGYCDGCWDAFVDRCDKCERDYFEGDTPCRCLLDIWENENPNHGLLQDNEWFNIHNHKIPMCKRCKERNVFDNGDYCEVCSLDKWGNEVTIEQDGDVELPPDVLKQSYRNFVLSSKDAMSTMENGVKEINEILREMDGDGKDMPEYVKVHSEGDGVNFYFYTPKSGLTHEQLEKVMDIAKAGLVKSNDGSDTISVPHIDDNLNYSVIAKCNGFDVISPPHIKTLCYYDTKNGELVVEDEDGKWVKVDNSSEGSNAYWYNPKSGEMIIGNDEDTNSRMALIPPKVNPMEHDHLWEIA